MGIKDFLKFFIPIGLSGLLGGLVEDRYFPGRVWVFMAFVLVGAVAGVTLLLATPPKEAVCTKGAPWDKKTLPVTHADAKFVDDSGLLECPNCGHCWSLGPDV